MKDFVEKVGIAEGFLPAIPSLQSSNLQIFGCLVLI
jgi:hypothetical protein